MRRGARAAAALLATATALAALVACTPKEAPAPNRTPVTAGVAADLVGYYGQDVD